MKKKSRYKDRIEIERTMMEKERTRMEKEFKTATEISSNLKDQSTQRKNHVERDIMRECNERE